jgi:hypothetical protein
MPRFRAAAALAVLALAATGCTQAEIDEWVATHPAPAAPTPGDCDSYANLFAAHGLPPATFKRIMRRESNCNPDLWVVDRDDDGGAGFGLNYKGSMVGYWPALCGMTKAEAKRGSANIDQIVGCVAAEYRAHGLQAWS